MELEQGSSHSERAAHEEACEREKASFAHGAHPSALAGVATLARTDSATIAETIVFMAQSRG
jgi:hypothetical protein